MAVGAVHVRCPGVRAGRAQGDKLYPRWRCGHVEDVARSRQARLDDRTECVRWVAFPCRDTRATRSRVPVRLRGASGTSAQCADLTVSERGHVAAVGQVPAHASDHGCA